MCYWNVTMQYNIMSVTGLSFSYDIHWLVVFLKYCCTSYQWCWFYNLFRNVMQMTILSGCWRKDVLRYMYIHVHVLLHKYIALYSNKCMNLKCINLHVQIKYAGGNALCREPQGGQYFTTWNTAGTAICVSFATFALVYYCQVSMCTYVINHGWICT